MADAMSELMQVLQQELRWQQDLAEVLEQKLDAMRRYDTSRLDMLTAREQQLAQRIQLHDKKRASVVRQAAAGLFPQQKKAWANARELALAAAEPLRSQLLSLAGLLREAVRKVQRLNNINRVASEKILNHFNQIFQIIAQTGRDIGLYGREGRKSLLEQNRLLDARA
jgi:flagellar biosynthesis/type III secretory pathway chaperone